MTPGAEPVPRWRKPPAERRDRGAAAASVARRGWLWRQVPAYSPLTPRTAWRAAAQTLVRGEDARPRVARLLRALYPAREALLLGSGTQALELAIRIAGRVVGEPSVVALPAFSCYDVATAAVGAGVGIALYDVDPWTLAPDLDSMTATLAEGARIIVVAPLFGVPIDWDAIEQCLAGFGALAIEDAAQGHGALWRGAPVGSAGALSVLSFGRGKGWTGGGGGALLVRRFPLDGGGGPRAPGVFDELAALGTALAQSVLGRPATYGLPAALPFLHLGETRFRAPTAVRRMTRAAAALLERTLPLATQEAAARRVNAEAMLARLPPDSRARAVTPPRAGTPGFLRLPLRIPGGLAAFAEPLRARRLGVAPGYPTTLAAIGAVRERQTRPRGRWPGAEELVRDLVTLPTHSLVSAAERDELLRLLE
jgi:dTDP-4-amino-4,6-dideoxygalactose transaminase